MSAYYTRLKVSVQEALILRRIMVDGKRVAIAMGILEGTGLGKVLTFKELPMPLSHS